MLFLESANALQGKDYQELSLAIILKHLNQKRLTVLYWVWMFNGILFWKFTIVGWLLWKNNWYHETLCQKSCWKSFGKLWWDYNFTTRIERTLISRSMTYLSDDHNDEVITSFHLLYTGRADLVQVCSLVYMYPLFYIESVCRMLKVCKHLEHML